MANPKNKNGISNKMQTTLEKVNHFAKVERFIAVTLTLTPLVLYLADFGFERKFRTSISDYAFMCDSYWFGSLLALAGALFIFNGAQHMSLTDIPSLAFAEKRFGKGYNIIFGIALFGVIYFDHEDFKVVHYIFAAVFYLGCALAMLLTRETQLKKTGDVLGILTILSLGLNLLLDWILGEDNNPFTLLWAEWLGLIFIAIYFVAESFERDKRELQEGIKSCM
ncbi:hypothetical protein [Maribacter sp. 2210JD10-5]|uniref:DUF7103 family protein n=1 Tax=Maribacter sp. 2210JD10-5 TaxID=3386272 RepID=UPI0039BD7980